MNNYLKKDSEGISNLFELESISININNIQNQINIISKDHTLGSFERKMRIRELNEEKLFLEKRLFNFLSIIK